jgi:hypothetical protein
MLEEVDMILDQLIKGIIAVQGGRALRVGNDYVLDIPTEWGRTQKVMLTHDRVQTGQEIIRYYTEVGPAFSAEIMRQALEANMDVPFGAFAINRGQLVMVDTQLLATADVPEVLSSIMSLAVHADQAEKRLFGSDRH